MNRLMKVIETGALGKTSGRVAYVLKPEALPDASEGFEWLPDRAFSAADAVLADASLKDVFSAAVRRGYAIVEKEH
jgi:hypothetical protein